MRIDVVSIFPAYLEPLGLSLPGKAQARGLLDLQVHDLRAWTRDRHHTVDDTPYGGGAGMVMKPDPWGEALDALDVEAATLVVPTPSGRPLTQSLARELSTRPRLVFACGRYEGIDQRVLDHYGERTEVVEVSLGDFVLNGGEVAALAVIEAVVRLLPGFMGNAESLVEESHEDGLLEYPVYTKPASWRGHEVPSVLLSGDHGRIAQWRHQQRLSRTAARRPDLLSASAVPGDVGLGHASAADAGELLCLQRACAVRPAEGVDASSWADESLADVRGWVSGATVLTARRGHRLLAAARAWTGDDGLHVDRLLVAPDVQGQGVGRQVLEHLCRVSPRADAVTVLVPAGAGRLLRAARRAGLRPHPSADPGLVALRAQGFPS